MEIRIRKIGLEEADQLREIGIETFDKAFGHMNQKEDMDMYLAKSFSEESIKSQLVDKDSIFYFVYINAEPKGYLKLNRGSAQTEKELLNTLEIERIYLQPECQGMEIGALLIKKSIAVAKEEKFDAVWLGVWDKNVRAIKFYERHGFVKFSEHAFTLGNDLQNDVLMKVEL